ILITAVSVSIAIEIRFITIHTQGYSSPTMDSYKHALCTAKILDLSQKGVIRDVGCFNGGIYECIHMNSVNSIYGDVLSVHQGYLFLRGGIICIGGHKQRQQEIISTRIKRTNILVVDDEPDIALTFKLALENDGGFQLYTELRRIDEKVKIGFIAAYADVGSSNLCTEISQAVPVGCF